jgi:hypothetical protein
MIMVNIIMVVVVISTTVDPVKRFTIKITEIIRYAWYNLNNTFTYKYAHM